MKVELRYAAHPDDVKNWDTARLRKEFLIENIFVPEEISLVYSMYDRYMVGGAMPVKEKLLLETNLVLKSENFLDRREMGIINVGGNAVIQTGNKSYDIGFKEALYLGKGTDNVIFMSVDPAMPAKLYINSAPAHHTYPSKKITRADAEIIVLGNMETSNHRTLNKLIVNSIVETCQLQMGMTELQAGSVWNTMPVHTHNRRMEAYFYFEVPEGQAVCHFMGEPTETRHIWMKGDEAVISPEWSIHSAAATSNYTFIWGMAGENLDYSDQNFYKHTELR